MALHNLGRASPFVNASYWFPDGEDPILPPNVSLSKIDATLFTHLFCAFANLDPQTHTVVIPVMHQPIFSIFTTTVMEKNPNVQTLLSIGGRHAEKSAFVSMASNPIFRAAFIKSSIETARANKFHGLDLAWEYPSSATEMHNFGKLVKEWRAAVVEESNRTQKLPLLLTAAVYYTPAYNSVSYPVQDIVDSLDWVNLIAFDFYGPGWSELTGPPAALSPLNPPGHSAVSGLNQWLSAGLPEKKAVLGFPYVGWAWTLDDVNNNGYNAPTKGAALTEDGHVNYAQVRKFIDDKGADVTHNATVTGDYCHAGGIWIGYDDFQSIVGKVKFAKHRNLLGYFSWHVGADFECALSRAASKAWNA